MYIDLPVISLISRISDAMPSLVLMVRFTLYKYHNCLFFNYCYAKGLFVHRKTRTT